MHKAYCTIPDCGWVGRGHDAEKAAHDEGADHQNLDHADDPRVPPYEGSTIDRDDETRFFAIGREA
jgi:hypothetical protein